VNSSDTFAIGIDLGATKIAAALVSSQGEVLASRQVLTEARQGTAAVLDRIATQVNELSGLISARQLLGVGLGTPGQVDLTSGVVRNAVNLGWDEVQLAAEVQLRLSRSLPIWVQKDANASALGEFIFGGGRGCPDIVYLGIGSGLGCGVVANGRLVMTGHLALPAVDGRSDLPATLSPAILKGLLRQKLGFDGVITTDAMDMGAIRQGEELGEEAIRAAQAGADLLLLTTKPEDQRRAHASLVQAIEEDRLDQVELLASAGRIRELKQWIAAQGSQPGLDILGSAAHRAVADEIAARSITLVRDQAALLPLRLDAGQRMAVIILRPLDLTPADTSSYVKPALAQALRSFHDGVDDYILPHAPEDSDVDAVIHALRDCDLVVIGTINASTQLGQTALVRAVLRTGIPTVVIALRMPYDLLAFPEASTYLCCYSILEPSMRALARALVGQAGCPGRLPVSIPGMYVIGHPNRSWGG